MRAAAVRCFSAFNRLHSSGILPPVRQPRPRPYFKSCQSWAVVLLPALLLILTSLRASAQNNATDSDEERRRQQFLRAREQMRALPPSPSPSKSAAKPTPAPAPTPTAPAVAATPAMPYGWNVSRPTPRPAPTPATSSSPTASPAPTPPPPTAAPSPAQPQPASSPPVVIIEKSGQGEEGDNDEEAPTPPPQQPPPKKRGFFARLFGFGGGDDDAANYRFLTRRVLDEINRASVRKGRWKYTVVHNSGTRQGSARAFDYYHRHVRHMPNGLAYHFVIGNGTTTRDGQIEIGDRWRRQINGGHVHSDYLNNIAIGICLVGDFNRSEPTAAQRAALDELITYLRKRVGRVDRRLSIVKAHREINPVPTDCPGNRFPYGWLHRKFD